MAVDQFELGDALHRVADERWASVLATGKTVPWEDAKAWLEARSHDERPLKPVGRKPAVLIVAKRAAARPQLRGAKRPTGQASLACSVARGHARQSVGFRGRANWIAASQSLLAMTTGGRPTTLSVKMRTAARKPGHDIGAKAFTRLPGP
jgi:hypothetical protein